MTKRNMLNSVRERGADCGLKVLDFLFQAAMIDDAWSTREERSFQWWCHQLAQRAWAEPPRGDHGEQISLVHVETDFLRNVPDSRATHEYLNVFQSLASQFAFIYLPAEKKIKLHSTVYVHEGNFSWISRLLQNAAGIQLCDAHTYQILVRLFDGSEPDITPHPQNGYRENPDELLDGLYQFYISRGAIPVKLPRGAFKGPCKELAQSSIFAIPDETGLTAEVHFVGDDPALARQMAGKKGVATSLLKMGTDSVHPTLGFGISSALILPPGISKEAAVRQCGRLNILESEQWTGCHMLGSWSAWIGEECRGEMVFGSFLPVIPFSPELITNLALSNGIRSKWASSRQNIG